MICYDLCCGLWGWGAAFAAEGFRVIGYDLEDMCAATGRAHPAGCELRIGDIARIYGAELADADCIVASPPCTEYAYMAMPWRRAKQIARALRGEGDFPAKYKGSRTRAELTALFDACFRIRCEASFAAGREIPLIVENVRGAQPWVGRAAWNFGSYYLWGDVPALMPIAVQGAMEAGGVKIPGQNWSRFGESGQKTPHWRLQRDGEAHSRHFTNPAEHDRGVKGFCPNGEPLGKNALGRKWGSKSPQRKEASALVAHIPPALARHFAAVFRTQARVAAGQ